MLKALLKTNYQFFISNPGGRILNRFSKDTYVLDEQIPSITIFIYKVLLALIGMMVTIIINAPFILVIILFQLLILY